MSEILYYKVLRFIFLFFGIVITTFVAIHLAPGSPIDSVAGVNPAFHSNVREKLARIYHLDKPVHEQFFLWAKGAIKFDFGTSMVDGQSTSQKILRALPITIGLNTVALAMALLFGIVLGSWMAYHRHSWISRAIDSVCLWVISMPSFWLAMIFVYYFALKFRLLPVSGLHSLMNHDWPLYKKILDVLAHCVLPISVLCIPSLAVITRYVYSSMREQLQMPYVRSARSRGLSEKRVVMNHALPNTVLPLITMVGLSMPAILGGSVVLESFFAIPGMGRLFYNSVFQRDYPVIMAILTLGSFLTLLSNLMADVAYFNADPRIRTIKEV